MEVQEIKKELAEIKQLTLLGVKKALTMKDAALFTGLSMSHLYKNVCYKKIPHYKNNGKLTYFDKDELTAWMLQHRVKTNDEISEQAATYCAGKKKGVAV